MLKPALLYQSELMEKFNSIMYTEDYYYYMGYVNCGEQLELIPQDDKVMLASVDNDDKVIGLLKYRTDYINLSVSNFGIISFDKGNVIFGIDLLKEFDKLYHTFHRIHWWMVGSNPVKKHYDYIVKKYGGYVSHSHDCIRHPNGEYEDSYHYEIINNDIK